MSGVIWEADRFWVFVLVTLVIGGATAMATGRAVAQVWQPLSQALVYMIPLTFAVRFLHYALFEGYFISRENFAIGAWHLVVTFVILAAIGALGWRMQRASMMARQYSWTGAGAAPGGASARAG